MNRYIAFMASAKKAAKNRRTWIVVGALLLLVLFWSKVKKAIKNVLVNIKIGDSNLFAKTGQKVIVDGDGSRRVVNENQEIVAVPRQTALDIWSAAWDHWTNYVLFMPAMEDDARIVEILQPLSKEYVRKVAQEYAKLSGSGITFWVKPGRDLYADVRKWLGDKDYDKVKHVL